MTAGGIGTVVGSLAARFKVAWKWRRAYQIGLACMAFDLLACAALPSFLLLLPSMSQGENYSASRATVDGIEVVRLSDARHQTEVSIVPSVGNLAFEMKVKGTNVFWWPYKSLADFKGLAKRSPWYAIVMTVLMFSLAGVPPMMGFMAKWAVLDAVVGSGQLWLAIIAVAASLVGAFYYLRVVKVMWFDEVADASKIATPLDMRVVLSLNGILVVVLGVLPGPLLAACLSAMTLTLKS